MVYISYSAIGQRVLMHYTPKFSMSPRNWLLLEQGVLWLLNLLLKYRTTTTSHRCMSRTIKLPRFGCFARLTCTCNATVFTHNYLAIMHVVNVLKCYIVQQIYTYVILRTDLYLLDILFVFFQWADWQNSISKIFSVAFHNGEDCLWLLWSD